MIKEDLSSLITRLRIITGLILFDYVFMHLLNHSFNLISIQSADFVRKEFFSIIWQNPIGIFALYFSLIVHMILGFYAIIIKKSFKLKMKDWIQIVLPILEGLTIVEIAVNLL